MQPTLLPGSRMRLLKFLAVISVKKNIDMVKASQWFTVIADEITDCSNKEQLSLVLRYVDTETELIREDVVGFLECDTGITGQCLADKLMGCLQAYDLDLTKLRGQAYDGAGNVAGTVKGAAAIISRQYHLLYTFTVLHTVLISL